MDLGLKESIVLVTGSSSGIGPAAAIAFRNEGARVTVTYHGNREDAEDTANKIRNVGEQAPVIQHNLIWLIQSSSVCQRAKSSHQKTLRR